MEQNKIDQASSCSLSAYWIYWIYLDLLSINIVSVISVSYILCLGGVRNIPDFNVERVKCYRLKH